MNSLIRAIFLIYFITHIPITLTLDLQGLFGEYYPQPLKDLATWYVDTYNDPLMRSPQPYWFKSFIGAELVFQMPFFFYATYALLARKNAMRIPSIVYGVHVATTVWAILAEFLFGNKNTMQEKFTLFAFYVPYFIIPAWLAAYMCMYEKPFGDEKPKKQ